MHRSVACLALALSLLAPASASAQIVDALSRFPGTLPEGFQATASLAAEWRTGNTDLFDLDGIAFAGWRRRRHTGLVFASGQQVVAQGRPSVEQTEEQLRYRYHANDFIEPELINAWLDLGFTFEVDDETKPAPTVGSLDTSFRSFVSAGL